jgi:hypothetical protein
MRIMASALRELRMMMAGINRIFLKWRQFPRLSEAGADRQALLDTCSGEAVQH